MADSFRDYSVCGEADPARARTAAVVDLILGCFVGILVWPFPVVRIALQDAAGSATLGWALHVPLLLTFMLAAACLSSGLSMAFLRRTVGMYFQDLGLLEAQPGIGTAVSIACPWTVAGLAGVFRATGPAGRLAAARLCSTRERG